MVIPTGGFATATNPTSFDLDERRLRARSILIYLILLAGYVLSFVHRTAPAGIAHELTDSFSINAAVLGTLAATYFYVYTVLQIPVGVLADTLGPRKIVTGGAVIAGAGSLLFGLAPGWELAAFARALIGVGVAVTFVALLKICASWFAPNRFATLNGITLLAGNLGAVLAGAPLAWLLTFMPWRMVFVALALLSVAIAVLTWLFVRDRPEDCGFVSAGGPDTPARTIRWQRALLRVVSLRQNWPCVFVNIGVAGSYFAFAGLWVVPYLREARGLSQAAAAQHMSVLVLGVAVGSFMVGILSDYLGSRLGLLRIYACLYALSWLPLFVDLPVPPGASQAWLFFMGLLVPGFTLTWTIAKEANRPEHSGMAVALTNVGIFLGAGVLQPLVGVVLDAGRGSESSGWTGALMLLAASAGLGALCTFSVSTGAAPCEQSVLDGSTAGS